MPQMFILREPDIPKSWKSHAGNTEIPQRSVCGLHMRVDTDGWAERTPTHVCMTSADA